MGYRLTMSEAVIYALILAYLLTLGIMGITLLLSSLLKSAYSVIIAAFLLILVPTFLSPDTGGYLWSRVISLLPSKIADFSFQSYTAYNLGTFVIRWPDMAMSVNGAAAVLCSLGSYRIFRSHQVNK